MTEVLTAPIHGASHFSSRSIHPSSHSDLESLNDSSPYSDAHTPKPSYTHSEYEICYQTSAPSSAPSSPQLTHSAFSSRPSYTSTPASSLSLDMRTDAEEDPEDIIFPCYDVSGPSEPTQSENISDSLIEDDHLNHHNHQSGLAKVGTREYPRTVCDDQAVEREPTRHVDYLSHDWQEEDIWSSWRYVVARRKNLSNGVRLENASWRTWMKAKNKLKTISPETLNWLKDCDVTWLYGPLQTDTKSRLSTSTSPVPSRLSTSSSFIHKKPILKKKSASAAILERSISSHSLLKQAGALLRAQQSSPAGRPNFGRSTSDFSVPTFSDSSVVNTPAEHETSHFSSLRPSFAFSELPSPSDCRHVEFSNTVLQVQAIESDDDDREEEPQPEVFSDDEDDDGGLMMRPPVSSAKLSNRSTPRGSFSGENKTIAPLPSTTLNYRGDTPDPVKMENSSGQNGLWPTGRKLSPSPSQETLRPPRPNHNFLIDDDAEDPDIDWHPHAVSSSHNALYDEPYEPGPGMRRTGSGMFMPYDESEDEAAMNNTLFGQVMNAVNTVKDITHVVWNVGWRRGS